PLTQTPPPEIYTLSLHDALPIWNLTRSGVKDIPSACPVCGGKTEIRQDGNARTLYCTNPDCQAKHVKSFALFVSRDALNIEGLRSEEHTSELQSRFDLVCRLLLE